MKCLWNVCSFVVFPFVFVLCSHHSWTCALFIRYVAGRWGFGISWRVIGFNQVAATRYPGTSPTNQLVSRRTETEHNSRGSWGSRCWRKIGQKARKQSEWLFQRGVYPTQVVLQYFPLIFFSVPHYFQIGTKDKLLDDIQTSVPRVLFLDRGKAGNDIH